MNDLLNADYWSDPLRVLYRHEVFGDLIAPTISYPGSVSMNGGAAAPAGPPAPGSVPLSALAGGPLPASITVPAASITGVLPASAIPVPAAGSVPATAIAPGTLPAGVKLNASEIVGVLSAANLPPIDCTAVVNCVKNAPAGSLPTSLLAPGSLPAGVTLDPATLTAGTTVATSWDPVGNILTTTVNGKTALTSLGSLDDEGATLAFAAGNLEMKSRAGVVLATVPIPDRDAQTLAKTVAAAGIDLAISGGNNVAITCADIGVLYPNGASVATDTLLTKNCKAVAINALPIAPSQLTAGALPAVVTVPAANITGQILAANLTHTMAATQATGITSTVNGVTATVAVTAGTIAQNLGFDAAGALVRAVAPIETALVATDTSTIDFTTSGTAGHALTGSVKLSATSGNRIVANADGLFSAPIPATTNVVTLTQAGGLTSTVDGVASTVAIAAGTIAQSIGFDAAGAVVRAAAAVETALVATDTSTIDFTTSGTAGHALTGSVKLSATSGNRIVANADGLFSAPIPATTNVLAITQANGFVSTVDGVASTVAVPAGTVAQSIGFDAAGAIVRGLAAAAETSLVATDTSTIDFTTSGTAGHALTGSVKISAAAGNRISSNADGLFSAAIPATTNTLTGTQATGIVSTVDGVTATLAIAAGTIAQSIGFDAAGAIVRGAAAAAETSLVATDTSTIDFTTSGTAGHALTGSVKLSATSGNRIVANADGLFSAPIPATTNVLAITQANGFVSTVDGVASTVAVPAGTVAQNIGFDAAGAIVRGPIPAATTNVLIWTKAAGLTSNVNSVSANKAIPAGTLVDMLGYNAAGDVVSTPVFKHLELREVYKSVAASYTTAAPVLVTGTLVDSYEVETLIEVTAAGATITLTTPSSAITSLMIGVEVDVKLTGNWVGTAIVAGVGAATIDGAATVTINKTAANQPSRSFRWTGSKWLIV